MFSGVLQTRMSACTFLYFGIINNDEYDLVKIGLNNERYYIVQGKYG